MSYHRPAVDSAAAKSFAAGDLDRAYRELAAELRVRPDDLQARMFLFQLQCITANWDKARQQAQIIARLSPEAHMHAIAYSQAIDGEAQRSAACAGAEPVLLLHASPGWMLDLVNAFATDAKGAGEMRARAFAACPDTPGEIDGRPFDYVFDGDGRFGPAIEAIVAGRWGLLPFCAIEEIRTEGPVDLRDLVWLPAQIRLREAGTVAALLPVRYPGTEAHQDGALRLARRTEWIETDGLVCGLGQRVWTTSTGEDAGILSFRHIRFAPLP